MHPNGVSSKSNNHRLQHGNNPSKHLLHRSRHGTYTLPGLVILSAFLLSGSLIFGLTLIRPSALQAYPASATERSIAVTDTNIIHIPILVQVGNRSINPTPTGSDATVTATATGTPQTSSGIEWDPRLDQRGAVLVPAQPALGQGYWRLIHGLWLDEEESEGRVHIFVDTLDEDAERQTGVPLLITWADGNTTIVTEEKPGEPAANFAMFTWAPAYDIRPNDGHPADRVNGLGLGSLEKPKFNIHTSYDFTWQWTIHSEVTATPTATVSPVATSVPTNTLTLTPEVSATTTISATPVTSATVTPTSQPSSTSTQPTPIPTSTPQPTVSPTPTSSATPTSVPTSLATPVVDVQFTFSRGELVNCVANQNQTLLNGTVFVDDEPASGYRVIFDFEADGDGVTLPQITRENPVGFYEHILGEGNWLVWIVDENGTRISVQVPFTINAQGVLEAERCRIATVNFYGE